MPEWILSLPPPQPLAKLSPNTLLPIIQQASNINKCISGIYSWGFFTVLCKQVYTLLPTECSISMCDNFILSSGQPYLQYKKQFFIHVLGLCTSLDQTHSNNFSQKNTKHKFGYRGSSIKSYKLCFELIQTTTFPVSSGKSYIVQLHGTLNLQCKQQLQIARYFIFQSANSWCVYLVSKFCSLQTKALLLINMQVTFTLGDQNFSPLIESIIESRVQSMVQFRVQSSGFVVSPYLLLFALTLQIPKGTLQNLDSGLDCGLDSGLNNGFHKWTKISIAKGKCHLHIINQQQSNQVNTS